MICYLCNENKAKFVIRNIHNDNRAGICNDCKEIFNFKDELGKEGKA